MHRRDTLLIGNGINLATGGGTSWEDVLRSASQFVGNSKIMQGWNDKSLPLIYEELYSEYVGKRGQKEFGLKEYVADKVSEVRSNDFHKKIVESGVPSVITTNYDLALEKSVESKWEKANLRRESKYSRYRRNRIKNTCVWHVHGACDAPNTIQLGHEHYSGQLQYLRDLVVNLGDKKTFNNKKSAFLQGYEDFDSRNHRHSWLDVFLRDDIHIVGVGMDFSEIDLWWAVAYKNRLRNAKRSPNKSKKKLKINVGSTTYHALEKAAENSRESARQNVLKSLGVRIEHHSNEGSYQRMYESVIALAS